MSSPGAAQTISRPDLRNQAVEEWSVSGEAATFIADDVAKRIDVDFAAGTVRRIPREEMVKDPNTLDRGPDGDYQTVEFGDETFTYFTKEQGLMIPVDANAAAQTKIYYDAQRAAARIALSKCKRMHEKAVAAAIQNTSTFTGTSLTTAISTSWKTANAATATPIADVAAARAKVRQNCGRDANTVIMDWQAFEYAIETTQVLGRINGGATNDQPARTKLATLALLFNVERVVVAGGIKDSAKQGQNFSGTSIWNSDRVMVAYINPIASLFDINLCNVYNWEGDGGSYDWTMETIIDEVKRREYVRNRRQVGVKVEYPECGHLLTNATA